MPDELISIVDLARQLGKRKQTVFKILRRMRIEPKRLKSSDGRGQLLSYITAAESRLIAAEVRVKLDTQGDEAEASPTAVLADEQGVFYLLELEPEHDPGRFKVGFALSLAERLRTLRCAAPFAKVVQGWDAPEHRHKPPTSQRSHSARPTSGALSSKVRYG